MTITIPTAELIGLLTDVQAFASADRDDQFHGIWLSWSNGGEDAELTASAYGVLSGAVATWVPGEGREGDGEDEGRGKPAIDPDDLPEWGGVGEVSSWSIYLDLGDVADVIKTFKVPAKLWAYPLQLSVSSTGQSLEVRRTDEFGKPAATMTLRDNSEVLNGNTFPDVMSIVAGALEHPAAVGGETFWNNGLGALGTVRSHASLRLVFSAEGYPTALEMAGRWHGFLYGANDFRSAQNKRAELGVQS